MQHLWQFIGLLGGSIKEEMTHVSHDFRTPLTTIKRYVHLLEQESNS
ncbi:TPA: hypothetical protein I1694_001994 [Staphylococcus pseudintermedius]|nr:hypothetical protein [Staphylococcus pseudintermedius]EGQ0307647.1 hypothetical protein [Staphylococcus pseudintermedius]EGQ0314816.1 hypothetical protein [Staphylococcus pseudintermedius]EGQ0358217.1 hypothetical protein [Staphylococcus pseudintermedius]EGQ0375165.1 hypothetical protein [Staphylococcus pseudintermedius]